MKLIHLDSKIRASTLEEMLKLIIIGFHFRSARVRKPGPDVSAEDMLRLHSRAAVIFGHETNRLSKTKHASPDLGPYLEPRPRLRRVSGSVSDLVASTTPPTSEDLSQSNILHGSEVENGESEQMSSSEASAQALQI
jgi:hypothetical protein